MIASFAFGLLRLGALSGMWLQECETCYRSYLRSSPGGVPPRAPARPLGGVSARVKYSVKKLNLAAARCARVAAGAYAGRRERLRRATITKPANPAPSRANVLGSGTPAAVT